MSGQPPPQQPGPPGQPPPGGPPPAGYHQPSQVYYQGYGHPHQGVPYGVPAAGRGGMHPGAAAGAPHGYPPPQQMGAYPPGSHQGQTVGQYYAAQQAQQMALQQQQLLHAQHQQHHQSPSTSYPVGTAAFPSAGAYGQPVAAPPQAVPPPSSLPSYNAQQPLISHNQAPTVPMPHPPPQQAPFRMQPSGSHTSHAKHIQGPYPAEIINNLGRYNVGDLCAIGRELVAELMYRTMILSQSLRSVTDRKPSDRPLAPPEIVLEHCQLLIRKLVEVRVRIERQMPKKRISAEDYIVMCSQPGEDSESAELNEQKEKFENNRAKLIAISSDLKMIDWKMAVSDPALLKKLDKLRTKEDKTGGGVVGAISS